MVVVAIFCLVCGGIGLYTMYHEWDEFDSIGEGETLSR